jgi:hypothetical protein
MLTAIAFVPVSDVVDAFDALIDAGYPARAEPIVDYFEDNFIGRPDGLGNRRSPVFSLTLWNVNQRVIELCLAPITALKAGTVVSKAPC